MVESVLVDKIDNSNLSKDFLTGPCYACSGSQMFSISWNVFSVPLAPIVFTTFSAKPIFVRKKEKKNLGNSIATLVFMQER